MRPNTRSRTASVLSRMAKGSQAKPEGQRRYRWVTIYTTKYRLGQPNARVMSYMQAKGYDSPEQMFAIEQVCDGAGGVCSMAAALRKVYVGSTTMSLRRRDNARANDFYRKDYRGTFPELGRKLIYEIGYEYGDDLHFDSTAMETTIVDWTAKAHLLYEDHVRCSLMCDYCSGTSDRGLHSAAFDTVSYSVAQFHRDLGEHGVFKTMALLSAIKKELAARYQRLNPFTGVHKPSPGYTVDDWGACFPGSVPSVLRAYEEDGMHERGGE